MTDPVEELLDDAELAADVRLRDFLVELRETATAVRPVPSAELAALLIPAPRRSALRRRGAVITTLVLVGTLAAGTTAAAASPDVRTATGRVIQAVVGAIIPATPPTPGLTASPHSTHAPMPPQSVNSSHPNATDHRGATDHPGSGAPNSSSNSHSDSGTSHPTGAPSAPPPAAPHGGASAKP